MSESPEIAKKPPAGAPEEIEVTPAMIEAAFDASRLYDGEDPKDWEMAAVYRAMERARRLTTVADHH
jgi:hypothetical protein